MPRGWLRTRATGAMLRAGTLAARSLTPRRSLPGGARKTEEQPQECARCQNKGLNHLRLLLRGRGLGWGRVATTGTLPGRGQPALPCSALRSPHPALPRLLLLLPSFTTPVWLRPGPCSWLCKPPNPGIQPLVVFIAKPRGFFGSAELDPLHAKATKPSGAVRVVL